MDGNQFVTDNHESLSETANSDYQDQCSLAALFAFLLLATIIQVVQKKVFSKVHWKH